ncbi:flagellar hook-associated protein FlgL [Fundidesulfovibrio butyratiphilus]
MRISFNMIYSNSMDDMNRSLASLAKAQEQMSSQQRINHPSDDPSGYAEARRITTTLASLSQYEENISTATNWLGQADSSLVSASTLLTSIQELAEQAATGTVTSDNRQEIASQVRSLFAQMLTLANTSVSGSSIFAGQKTDGDAYVESLFASVKDDTLTQDNIAEVTGASETSVLVKFNDSGVIGGGSDIEYTYSTDGGTNWTTKTLAAGDTTLDLGSCAVTMTDGSQVTATSDPTDLSSGTSLVVRPSATYLGNANDGSSVRSYGASQISATADGVFSGNVTVRILSNASLSGTISYAYSLDGGASWTAGNTTSNARLAVPGGFLTLASNGGSSLSAGAQFTIVPYSADIRVGISPTGSVVINNVGKDIFGGLYQSPGSSNATPVFSVNGSNAGTNIFETIGELIGCLETNDADGVGDCMDKLSAAHIHLEDCTADVGGRENRLTFASNTIGTLTDNAESRLSTVQDADLGELLIQLTKESYTYQCVLSSSTKIMSMSLLNYL